MDISLATPDDRDWAGALLASTDPWIRLGRTLEQCLAVCRDPVYEVWVARAEGERCGALLLQERGVAGSPYLKAIAVAASHRGRGVGAALMDFAEARFRPAARHFFLCVSDFNIRARAFYERRGWTVVGELPDYTVDGASEILMHLRLR
jgi:ribosomal-protein-alanine N-acetyltransferase